MRKSIFDLEVRIDIDYEFENLKNLLFERNAILYQSSYYNLYEIINDEILPVWKYKGVIIDFDDFCNRLDIDWAYNSCSEEKFLYLIELLINLWKIIEYKIILENEEFCSKKILGYMRCSLPLIVEKLNYQIIDENDKLRIVKRDSDADSIIENVPNSCASLLLDYNDIRNNSINSKKTILKELDMYIEKNKKMYQSLENDTYNSIQVIVNKMGVNHPIKEEPYASFDDEKIVDWYDKCFKLIIHLIRKKVVKEINDERKSFVSD
jgi:hypothetical protein